MDIIFDVCGVILEWKPNQIIDKFFFTDEIKKTVKEEIIFHSDWKELDRGTLSKEELIGRSSARTGISIIDITRMINSIPSSLLPIPNTVKIIKSIKEKGHKLFILSNIPFMSIEYVEKEYPFFALFDGMVISCRVNLIKPEPEIYKHLLGKYNIQKEKAIFIDDSENNIKAATDLGIRSITFINPQQCESELIKADIL